MSSCTRWSAGCDRASGGGLLLALAVVITLLSSLGVLLMRDVYQRLHYVAPIAMVATVLVAVAVTVREGWDENTGSTWLALGFVILTAPYLSHATIRAARIRDRGDWRGAEGPSRNPSRPKTTDGE